MLECIKAEDIQGIPIYIRKPFIRNQLYNGNISSNIEITDFENHKRIIYDQHYEYNFFRVVPSSVLTVHITPLHL